MRRQGKGSGPKIIRPLGSLERYQSSLHVLDYYRGTLVACRYSVPPSLSSSGVLNDGLRDAIRTSVACTVLEQPLLQVGLLNEDSARPSWIELDTLDLDYHVSWITVKADDNFEGRMRELIQHQLDSRFPDLETKPGWKVHVVAQDGNAASIEIIFTWNHANCDGVSGRIFHEFLLHNLNNTKSNTSRISYIRSGILALPEIAERFPPPAEKLGKFPLTPGFAIATAWRELKPSLLRGKDPMDASWSPIQTTPYETAFRTEYVDESALMRVLAKCRLHKTTLTGLLHALTLASLALQLREGPKPVDTLSAVTALDLRRFMPTRPKEFPSHEPHKIMDDTMGFMQHHFDADLVTDIRRQAISTTSSENTIFSLQDIVWSVAARCRSEIQRKLDMGLKNDLVGMLKFVGDFRAQMREEATKPRSGAWAVSNLGVLDGTGPEDGWSIDRSAFQLSAEVPATVFHVSAISTKGKGLCVDISWQKCVVDGQIGERLASDIKEWLESLGKSGETANTEE